MKDDLTDFTQPPAPGPGVINGVWARLERLDPNRHAESLFAEINGQDQVWDYLGYGPFADVGEYRDWMAAMVRPDPYFYAIIDPDTGKAAGLASFLRIDSANGVVEIGHIMLSPGLQRSRAASAALMAMIRWAFESGYRRVEWKCNAMNAASRRAALRFGFTYEGVFRQHMIVKNRNRDTAWFAITDSEWPGLQVAFDRWLEPENFDSSGLQKQSLSTLTHQTLPGRSDPLAVN